MILLHWKHTKKPSYQPKTRGRCCCKPNIFKALKYNLNRLIYLTNIFFLLIENHFFESVRGESQLFKEFYLSLPPTLIVLPVLDIDAVQNSLKTLYFQRSIKINQLSCWHQYPCSFIWSFVNHVELQSIYIYLFSLTCISFPTSFNWLL